MVAAVIIYSTLMCPFCMKAKNLMDSKGVVYEEIFVDKDQSKLTEMLEKSNGKRSVPQIIINGKHVGGFDDLKALNDKGELDQLLHPSG